jgi:hypothetical protein
VAVVLSVVIERLDVGRDAAAAAVVVDIRLGLEEEERGGDTVVDFEVVVVEDDGVTFKRDEATDDSEATDFPAVLCDRTEEDRDLVALTPEIDPDPVREERVDREETLAKDARVINTFLIVC